MLRNEYVETLVLNGKMINIGQDDAGQCYFVEWVDNNGELIQESCGAYNFHYKEYAEYKFGDPKNDCPYYNMQDSFHSETNCEHKNDFGYCDKCKYSDLKWHAYNLLIELGIIDRRGNIQDAYKEVIIKKEDKNNA